MTKKEIIDGLKFTVGMFLFDPSTGETITEPRNDMDKTTIEACKGAIELLEQEPKTGHWIMSEDGLYRPLCDKCGAHPWKGYIPTVEEATEVFKYCPNCGAKMQIEG